MCWYCNVSWLLVARERFSRLSPRMEKASWCTRSPDGKKALMKLSHETLEELKVTGMSTHIVLWTNLIIINSIVIHWFVHIFLFLQWNSESFVERTRYLLKLPGVTGHYFLSERLSQDPIENYFGRQRARGGRSDNPTVKACLENAQSLRVQGSFALQPLRGNSSRKKRLFPTEPIIDNTPLTKQPRWSKKE